MKKISLFLIAILILQIVTSTYSFAADDLDFSFKTQYTDLVKNQNMDAPNVLFTNDPINITIRSQGVSSGYKLYLYYSVNNSINTVGFQYDNKTKNTIDNTMTGVWGVEINKSVLIPDITFPGDVNVVPAKITLVDVNNSTRKAEKYVMIVNSKNWDLYSLDCYYLRNGYNSNASVKNFHYEMLIPKINPEQESKRINQFIRLADFLGVTTPVPKKVDIFNMPSKQNMYEIMKTVIYAIDENIISSEIVELGISVGSFYGFITNNEAARNIFEYLGTATTLIDLAQGFESYFSNLNNVDNTIDCSMDIMSHSSSNDLDTYFDNITGFIYNQEKTDDCNSKWNNSSMQTQYDIQSYVYGADFIDLEVQKKLTYIQCVPGNHSSSIYNAKLAYITRATKALVEIEKNMFQLIIDRSGL